MAVTDARSHCQDRIGRLGSGFSVFPSERLELLLSSSFIQDPNSICNCFPTTPWDLVAWWGLAEGDRGIEQVLDGCSFGEDGKHVNPPPWICSSRESCGKVMILLSLMPLDVTKSIFSCTPSACPPIWKFSGEPSYPHFWRFMAVWAGWVCCQACSWETNKPQSQENERTVLYIKPQS